MAIPKVINILRKGVEYNTETYWNAQTNYIPASGSIIVYTDLNKMKIGDGTTKLEDLNFISVPVEGNNGDALVKNEKGSKWETPIEATLIELPIGTLKSDGTTITGITTKYLTTTLAVANWSNKTYSFETTYPNSQYDITVSVAPTATTTEYDAFSNAKICGDATQNIIKAIGTVPTIAVPVIIKVVSK